MLLLVPLKPLLNAPRDEQLTTSLVVFLVGTPETLLSGPRSEAPGFMGKIHTW